ncbi:Copper metallochaperone, bacterial analog of Cox17 protein [Polaromonas sp. CG9_12]|uniref:copper chaperone PCu(A)C n=1 Tax=Polaromonas sp. CG_9.11 TaxID=2787730 RepID=UPI0004DDD8E6|nr:copper chaperone PCu(A)C [Polaromonas sp. CG_9.11]MBG6074358.1 copper(I)-binding protein [Polaromonas sp. CG_9.11]CDS54492.1 Copper metallochaperone, bacterial analog of Cox17 protein [Polaromonas sp. CG9_12]
MKLKLFTASLLFACSTLHAQTVEVKDAWVRATVPSQKGTGAFMSITAKDGARLVGVSSPVAGVVEVHDMKMDGDIMRMRAVPVLELPAGQTVHLKPGGYHVMLMDLKQGLPKGSTVPLTLRLQDAQGVETRLEVSVPVSTAAPAGNTTGKAADHGAHKH